MREVSLIKLLCGLVLLSVMSPIVCGSDFTANKTTHDTYPFVVQFYDNTTTSPTSWNWSFGEGHYSTSQHPIFPYAVAGNYTVILNATNATGSTIITKTDYIRLSSDVDDYVVSWLHMNGTNGNTTFKGETGVAWLTSGAAQITTGVFKYGGSAGDFTGSKAYIWTPHETKFNFSTNDFTAEMWVRPTSSSQWLPIFGKGNNVLTSGWGVYHSTPSASSDGWKFYMGDYTTGSTGTFTLPLNQWSHLVIERINGNATVFVNGVVVAYKSGLTGNYDTTNPIYLGFSPNKYFGGYLDEARLSVGVARWKANFVTPYDQYKGVIYTDHPDINPDSTMQYKAPIGTPSIIGNGTDYGSGIGVRNRSIQIVNVRNTSYVVGAAYYNASHTTVQNVYLNTSTYSAAGSTLQYSIDHNLGIVYFNVSRPTGFNNGTSPASIIDYQAVYDQYHDPELDPSDIIFFAYGYLINTTTGHTYPIHNFVGKPLDYAPWNFTVNFTANTTTQSISRPILFNATFTGSYPNRYNWSWGDGTYTNSADANVTHIYNSVGTFTVSLTEYMWQNTSLNNTVTHTGYITIVPQVVADFSSNVHDSAYAPLTVQFYDNSTGGPIAWNWSFGDGTYNESQHPVHTYQYYANYTVTLAINDGTSSDTETKVDYIHVGIPNILVDFTATPLFQVFPDATVDFTSLSYEDIPDGWNWSFGDGTYSNSASPTHTYPYFGFWSIGLTAINNSSTNSTFKANYVAVAERPVASFTADPTHGYVINESGDDPLIPASIYFTDTSNNATAWKWDFGDFNETNTSTERNPVHEYNITGNFTVNLTITNAFGLSNTTIMTDYIRIDETSVIRIKADVGENYIRWKWGTSTPYYVMIDGRYVTTDVMNTVDVNGTPITYSTTEKLITYSTEYPMENLEPNSEHRIALYAIANATIPSAVGTAKTLPHSTTVYILVVMVLALCVVGIVLLYVNPMYVLLLCVMNIVISLFGLSIGYNTNGLSYIFYVGIIYSVIMIGYALYKTYGESVSWW